MAAPDDVVTVLRRDFPALRVDSVRLLGTGWNNVAYLVDDELVFRLASPTSGTQWTVGCCHVPRASWRAGASRSTRPATSGRPAPR